MVSENHPSGTRHSDSHSRVDSQPRPSADWSVRFRDLSGAHVDTFQGDSPLLVTRGIWSSEIRDRGAIVELVTDTPGLDLEIVVDRYAYRETTTAANTVTSPSVIDVTKAPLDVQTWAEPVARLRFIQENRQFTCTGVLVRPTLVLTAGYCATTRDAALSAIADFGFDSALTTPKSFRVTKLEAVSPALDYALLRLGTAPDGFKPATLKDAASSVGEPLVIIHHLNGSWKQASIDCQVSGSPTGAHC